MALDYAGIEHIVWLAIAEELPYNVDAIAPQHTLDDLDADSLDAIEIVMRVEEELEIEISDEDAHKLTTVKSLVDYVAERMGMAVR